ncbi:M61 family metallopeptidase [Glaciecola sp. 2405UD65-10]|uniref:M61 family metallopeptidase n=1 Tax=Glaciecola sp. 2405UD65-10 TaxID=3397244 RepID=UPI003B5CEA63
MNLYNMTTSTIRYDLSLLSSTEHLLQVNMYINHLSSNEIELSLPAWIPGSYMVRDFARNLHALQAACPNNESAKLEVTQLNKQSWKISCTKGEALDELLVTYQIYAYDLSVRSAFINQDYAFFNGTSVFLYINNVHNIKHSVTIDEASFASLTPNALSRIATAMPKSNVHTPGKAAYTCNNYYDLIDHPFLIGCLNYHSFSVNNTVFHLAFTGQHPYDLHRIADDLTPIIKHHMALFGEIPCEEYWFMTLICDGGFGGLEHIASTVLQYNRFDIPFVGDNKNITPGYQQFLSLCSHELFHTWHVKQIKPQVMHQVDLSKEVYTPQLWIYEGFTSLYDDLSLARTGLISPKDYVQVLNETLTRLLKNQGRHKQSVSQSSFEAWSKFYKQDAGSVNHIVSYYNKGAVVALCLDITIRQHSQGKHSLDTIMQLLWKQYGKPCIGTPDDVITQLCEKELNLDISHFLNMVTSTTVDLPLHSILQQIGLQLKLRPSQNALDKGGEKPLNNKTDWGAVVSSVDKMLRVNAVYDGRGASKAGLMHGDTIVAVDSWQCDEAKLITILNQKHVGETLPIHVLRDAKLIELEFTVSEAPADTCAITVEDETLFHTWLGLQ